MEAFLTMEFISLAVMVLLVGLVVIGGILLRNNQLARFQLEQQAFEQEKNRLMESQQALQSQLDVSQSSLQSLEQKQAQLERDLQELTVASAVKDEQLLASAQLKEQISKKEESLNLAQTNISQLEQDIAGLKLQLQHEKKQAEEKIALLNEAKEQLKFEFQNLANQIFEAKGKKFTDQNQTNLNTLLSPLKEQLKDFKAKVEDVYVKEAKDRTSLFNEIVNLKNLNQQISEDAINLTKALKGENKTQGNWGEMILERVLEESGLHKGREYVTQGSFTSEEGKRLQPDVVVHLPEGKDVVIDSKVSLNAYERFCSAEADEERSVAIKEHIQSIQTHVKGLSGKDYSSLTELRSLDFVLMFIPIEAAFLSAVEAEPALFSQAFDRNIMIVCPSTLLVTLRTIQNNWRYEYQNQNATKIADQAGGIYDQLVLFVESLEDVGDKLNKAQDAFGKAQSRLVDGRGNLVRRVEGLKKLGAKTKKQLDKKLKEEAMLNEDGLEDDELLSIESPIEKKVEEADPA